MDQKDIDHEVAKTCFHMWCEHLLSPIHDVTWLQERLNEKSEEAKLIRKLLEDGSKIDDLAQFARLMQRKYLGDLGCLLDGAGIGDLELPYSTFRVFSITDGGNPEHVIDEIHEAVAFENMDAEQELSQRAASNHRAYLDELDETREFLSQRHRLISGSEGVAPYSNNEIASISEGDFPERGIYCHDCGVNVPVFEAFIGEEFPDFAGYKGRLELVIEKTGCTKLWAEIWALHPHGECNTKRCSSCGAFMRSKKAKQCLNCGLSLH